MKSLNQNSQDNRIKLLTDKLNKLRIKVAMFKSADMDVPEYIFKDIKLLEDELRNNK